MNEKANLKLKWKLMQINFMLIEDYTQIAFEFLN